MNRALFFVAVFGMAVAACQDQQPVAPAMPQGPVFQISDGHTGGNSGFFFLFPIRRFADDAKVPATGFNPDLAPVIEVYECAGTSETGCVLPLGALKSRITKTSGSLFLNRLYVNPRFHEYDALWDTRGLGLRTDRTYRIQVSVGSRVLGFADVDVVRTIREAAAVNRDEFVPLLQNWILPIRFWVGNDVLCTVSGVACASKTINLSLGGGIELLAAGEDFKVDIPAGTTASFGGHPVTDLTVNVEVCSGIDVDLPRIGQCLRLSTFFDATGPGELEFSKQVLISMCVLNSVYHTPNETRQEDLITLHQQDGPLVRALPHVAPNCTVIGTSGWEWLKSLAARFLAPTPAYAANRTAVLHVGAGGGTGVLGATCTPAPSPVVPGLMLSTVCPPTSAIAPSGPQRSVQAAGTPAQTVSDFQFALPAKMDYLNRGDASRAAPAGTALPTAVKVTDWDGTAVQGARVTFTEPAIEGPGTIIGTATSNADGVAQINWTIRAGSNTVVASGRGIAAQNNYPDATVKPFMPDITPGVVESPVALGTGRVTFTATGTTGLTGYEVISGTTTSLTASGGFYRDAVQCSAGKVVLGGGAAVVGEGTADFNTLIQESGPGTVNGGAISVWAVSIKNGDASSHNVQIFAVCANPPAGYQVVTNGDFPLTAAGGFIRTTAQCPAGTVVFGGGASVVGEGTADFNTRIQESGPGTVNGGAISLWSVSMKNGDCNTAHTVRLSAICGTPPSGYQVIPNGDFSLGAAGGSVRQTAQCPSGTLVLGGGASVVGEGTADFNTRIQESAPGTTGGGAISLFLVSMKNQADSPHTVRLGATCAQASP